MSGLPDIIAPDLELLFCGMAPGRTSAALGHYYARPGNKFWRVLFSAGLTPRPLQPHEDHDLLSFGIGLTDLAKGVAGNDRDILPGLDVDAARTRLMEIIAAHRPRRIALNGKEPARQLFGKTAAASYGRQRPSLPGAPEIWVLPSTSGMASKYWDEAPWQELGAAFRSGKVTC